MQITVFGASGKVGSLVVEEALRRGFSVVAFVHNQSLFAPSNQLIIQKGDIYNESDVRKALQQSEAVISCLGSWGTPKKDVLTSAVRSIVPIMHEYNIKRIVTLTGSGASAPGAKVGAGHTTMLRLLRPFPAGKVFRDGEEHMRRLADSDLDWTTLRSPVMNNLGSDGYQLRMQASQPWATIRRTAVAIALLDQIGRTEYLRQAPIISRSDVGSIGHPSKV